MSLLPQEIAEGTVRIHPEEGAGRVAQVRAYNEYLADLRMKMKRAEKLEIGMLVLHIVCGGLMLWLLDGLGMIRTAPIFSKLLLAADIAAVIYVVYKRRSLLAGVLAPLVLLLLNLRFLLLPLLSLPLFAVHERLIRRMRTEPGFPHFPEIAVEILPAQTGAYAQNVPSPQPNDTTDSINDMEEL